MRIGGVDKRLVGQELFAGSPRESLPGKAAANPGEANHQPHGVLGVLLGETETDFIAKRPGADKDWFLGHNPTHFDTPLVADFNKPRVDGDLLVLHRDLDHHHVVKADLRHLMDKQGHVAGGTPGGRDDGRAFIGAAP